MLGRILPGRRALAAVDATLVAWTLAWIAMGMSVSDSVEGLTSTTFTISRVGAAIDQVGGTLESIAGIPLVGDRVKQPAARIRAAGRSAVASGADSRKSIHRLSTLLGLAVALIPSVPLIAIYLPLRIGRLRETRALERAVRSAGDDPGFVDFLARRALLTLPYRELRRLGIGPRSGADEHSALRLAQAELDRLGVRARLGRPS